MTSAEVARVTEWFDDTDRRLFDLAQEINREHELGVARLSGAVPHFIKAGELLLDAKDGVPKGEWMTWLRENFVDSQRTAQLYMRLAAYKDEIPEDMPSLAEAMRWLNGRPRTDSGEWADTLTRTGHRSAVKRSSRDKRRKAQRALAREERARAAKKRGGTIASGYSHLRVALQDFERALEQEQDLTVRQALERVIHGLYSVEDDTKHVLGLDHGRHKTAV